MGIDAVARLLSVSAQKLMKGAYGIDRRILGGGLKRGRSSIPIKECQRQCRLTDILWMPRSPG